MLGSGSDDPPEGEASVPLGGNETKLEVEKSEKESVIEEATDHCIHRIEERHGRHLLLYEGTLKDRKVRILIDSGATGCFMSTDLADRLQLKKVQKVKNDQVQLADGTLLESGHLVQQEFVMGGYREVQRFHLVSLKGLDLVLGGSWLRRANPQIDWKTGVSRIFRRGKLHVLCPLEDKETRRLAAASFISHLQLKRAMKKEEAFLMTLRELDLVDEEEDSKKELDPSQLPESPALQERMQALLARFRDVVPEDPGFKPPYPPKRAVDHAIETIPGMSPPNKPVYRMSPAELEELKKQLADLLERGLIKPSTSPYASPIIFVKKKDGGFRLCIDYRALNNMTVKNKYPLPRIDDLLDRLHGAKYFTKMDMASGYHQVRLAEEDVYKSAFRTRYGHYEWTVLPFGMTNAPATFMRLMHDIFMPYLDKWVIIYLDDILVFSETEEEHERHVETVLELLRKHELYTKPSKCMWGVSQVDFLGHVVSRGGIAMDSGKVKAIRDWPEPQNAREVLQFKGLVGFYRRFVEQFSKLAAPLSALTGSVPFKWGTEERESFEALKKAITTAPVLRPPDPSKRFVVTTDASEFAIGAVLSQGEKSDHQVVAYESRKLHPSETRYAVHDKELLAIVHALVKWRHYLHGGRFTIETDSWACKFIQTKPQLTRMQAKWMEIMQEFDCDLVHRPGVTNVVADALSRRPDHRLNAMTEVRVEEDFLPAVKGAAEADPEYRKLRDAVEANKSRDFQLKNGLLYFKGDRLYVPEGSLRHKLLHEAHDAPLSGHLGRDKTIARLAQGFYWPRMHQSVGDYCKTCETCQVIKPSQQGKLGLLMPHAVPERPGQVVSMDFITQLPKTKRGHTSIFGITDCLTGLVSVNPTMNEVTAEGVASLFWQNWVRHYGLPEKIISDRDVKFTSGFWKELFRLLGTDLNMSTANHPETDGRSERTNRTLEDVLRAYVSPFQDDWDEHLVGAEVAINSAVHKSTGRTPYELTLGQNPKSPLTLLMKTGQQTDPESADAFVRRRQEDIEAARKAMQEAQERQAMYANRTRRDMQFEVGDKVYLAASHVRLPASEVAKRKFEGRFHGPYKIKEVISPVAYKLEFPPGFKIHPVVHISHLQPHQDGSEQFPQRAARTAPPPPEVLDEEQYYKIEHFVNHRVRYGIPSFRVKFVGYAEPHNQWMAAGYLRREMKEAGYKELCQEYQERARVSLGKDFLKPPMRDSPGRA